MQIGRVLEQKFGADIVVLLKADLNKTLKTKLKTRFIFNVAQIWQSRFVIKLVVSFI